MLRKQDAKTADLDITGALFSSIAKDRIKFVSPGKIDRMKQTWESQ